MGQFCPWRQRPAVSTETFVPLANQRAWKGPRGGGWEERGVGGVGVRGEARGLVCGAARAAPRLSVPAGAASRPSRRRAPPHPRAPHTLARPHTRTRSAWPRGSHWAAGEHRDRLRAEDWAAFPLGLSPGRPQRAAGVGSDTSRSAAGVGPPGWLSRALRPAGASAGSAIKSSGRSEQDWNSPGSSAAVTHGWKSWWRDRWLPLLGKIVRSNSDLAPGSSGGGSMTWQWENRQPKPPAWTANYNPGRGKDCSLHFNFTQEVLGGKLISMSVPTSAEPRGSCLGDTTIIPKSPSQRPAFLLPHSRDRTSVWGTPSIL